MLSINPSSLCSDEVENETLSTVLTFSYSVLFALHQYLRRLEIDEEQANQKREAENPHKGK
jgi:hypothetical protein